MLRFVEPGQRLTRHPRQHPVASLDDSHVLAESAQRRCGFQANVSAADDHDTLGARQLQSQIVYVAARPQGVNALQARACACQVPRPSSRSPNKYAVVKGVTVLKAHRSRGGVHRQHSAAEPQ